MEYHSSSFARDRIEGGKKSFHCTLAYGPDDIICAGSDTEDTPEQIKEKRRRYEHHAQRIEGGKLPVIQSAALKGPFTAESGWRNPWRYQAREKEEWWQPGDDNMLFTREKVMRRAAQFGLEHLNPAEALAWCRASAKAEAEEPSPQDIVMQSVEKEDPSEEYDQVSVSQSIEESSADESDDPSPAKQEFPNLQPENHAQQPSRSSKANRGISTPYGDDIDNKGRKRPIDAQWLKGSYVSKRARWEDHPISTPTPLQETLARGDSRKRLPANPIARLVNGGAKQSQRRISSFPNIPKPKPQQGRNALDGRSSVTRATSMHGVPAGRREEYGSYVLNEESHTMQAGDDEFDELQIVQDGNVLSQSSQTKSKSRRTSKKSVHHPSSDLEPDEIDTITPSQKILSKSPTNGVGKHNSQSLSPKLPTLPPDTPPRGSGRGQAVDEDYSFITEVAPSSRNVEKFQFKKKRKYKDRDSNLDQSVPRHANPDPDSTMDISRKHSSQSQAKFINSGRNAHLLNSTTVAGAQSSRKMVTSVAENEQSDTEWDTINDFSKGISVGSSFLHDAARQPVEEDMLGSSPRIRSSGFTHRTRSSQQGQQSRLAISPPRIPNPVVAPRSDSSQQEQGDSSRSSPPRVRSSLVAPKSHTPRRPQQDMVASSPPRPPSSLVAPRTQSPQPGQGQEASDVSMISLPSMPSQQLLFLEPLSQFSFNFGDLSGNMSTPVAAAQQQNNQSDDKSASVAAPDPNDLCTQSYNTTIKYETSPQKLTTLPRSSGSRNESSNFMEVQEAQQESLEAQKEHQQQEQGVEEVEVEDEAQPGDEEATGSDDEMEIIQIALSQALTEDYNYSSSVDGEADGPNLDERDRAHEKSPDSDFSPIESESSADDDREITSQRSVAVGTPALGEDNGEEDHDDESGEVDWMNAEAEEHQSIPSLSREHTPEIRVPNAPDPSSMAPEVSIHEVETPKLDSETSLDKRESQSPWGVEDIRPIPLPVSTGFDSNRVTSLSPTATRESAKSPTHQVTPLQNTLATTLNWQQSYQTPALEFDSIKPFSAFRSPTPTQGPKHAQTPIEDLTSTQVLIDAATRNPWKNTAKKNLSAKSTKRVSFGIVESEDTESQPQVPRNRKHKQKQKSPPPTLTAEDEDVFDDETLPVRRFTKHIEITRKFRRLLPDDTEDIVKSSPTLGAQAEAFITADEERAAVTASLLKTPTKVPRSRVSDGVLFGDSQKDPWNRSLPPQAARSVHKELANFDMEEALGDIGNFLENWSVEAEMKNNVTKETQSAGRREDTGFRRRKLFGLV